MWLVHRKPDGAESVQHQNVRISGNAWDFSFPPIQVSTSRGVVTLDITGKLQVTPAGTEEKPDGGQYFYYFNKADPASAQGRRVTVSLNRRARAAVTPRSISRAAAASRSTSPSPTDVLSFEFPALQKETEDLLKGHQFSLRVRIAPAGK